MAENNPIWFKFSFSIFVCWFFGELKLKSFWFWYVYNVSICVCFVVRHRSAKQIERQTSILNPLCYTIELQLSIRFLLASSQLFFLCWELSVNRERNERKSAHRWKFLYVCLLVWRSHRQREGESQCSVRVEMRFTYEWIEGTTALSENFP